MLMFLNALKTGAEDMDTSRCTYCEHNIAICKMLAKYEDSGLTPEEIVQLNTFAGSQIEKLLADNAQLWEERDAAVTDLQTIFERKREYANKDYFEIDGICDLCGCFAGGYKTECHGDCTIARWRGLEAHNEQN